MVLVLPTDDEVGAKMGGSVRSSRLVMLPRKHSALALRWRAHWRRVKFCRIRSGGTRMRVEAGDGRDEIKGIEDKAHLRNIVDESSLTG